MYLPRRRRHHPPPHITPHHPTTNHQPQPTTLNAPAIRHRLADDRSSRAPAVRRPRRGLHPRARAQEELLQEILVRTLPGRVQAAGRAAQPPQRRVRGGRHQVTDQLGIPGIRVSPICVSPPPWGVTCVGRIRSTRGGVRVDPEIEREGTHVSTASRPPPRSVLGGRGMG